MRKNTIKIISVTLALMMVLVCAVTFVACGEMPTYTFGKTTRFCVDFQNITLSGGSVGAIIAAFVDEESSMWLIDAQNSYVEFYPDGTMHAQIQTAPDVFSKIAALLEGKSLNDVIADLHLENLIEIYVEPMFPGWTEKVNQADLKGAMALVEGSLGFSVKGIDFDDEGVKSIAQSIANNMTQNNRFKIDDDIDTLAIFQSLKDEDGQGVRLSIEFDNCYKLLELTAQDQKIHQAIYVGEISSNTSTQPWAVLSMTNNADSDDLTMQALGGRRVTFTLGIANATVPCNEVL